jgi:hypothetical protein
MTLLTMQWEDRFLYIGMIQLPWFRTTIEKRTNGRYFLWKKNHWIPPQHSYQRTLVSVEEARPTSPSNYRKDCTRPSHLYHIWKSSHCRMLTLMIFRYFVSTNEINQNFIKDHKYQLFSAPSSLLGSPRSLQTTRFSLRSLRESKITFCSLSMPLRPD